MNQWLTPRKAEEFNQISADLRWHLPYGHFDKRTYQEIHQQWQKHLTVILLYAPYQHFGLYCVMYNDMFTFIWWMTRVNGLYNQTKTIERHHKHGHLASHASWLRETQANIIVAMLFMSLCHCGCYMFCFDCLCWQICSTWRGTKRIVNTVHYWSCVEFGEFTVYICTFSVFFTSVVQAKVRIAKSVFSLSV